MGWVPMPPPLTFKEFKRCNGRDIRLERWLRYESLPLGCVLWLWEQYKSCI